MKQSKCNIEICLLGTSGDFYTKAVIKHFKELSIPFDVITVRERSSISKLPVWMQRIVGVLIDLNSGKYSPLSKWSLFTYFEYMRSFIFFRTDTYRRIVEPYVNINVDEYSKLIAPCVNHVKIRSFIKKNGYKIGILAGVGIVHEDIINSFSVCCLNAHPAPLPECRGGGALQQTLYRGYNPSASVHYVNSEIDAGDILDVAPLLLKTNDTMESISLRLSILCAERLSVITKRLLSGEQFVVTENNGEIRYWKDSTKEVQKTARRNLGIMLSHQK